MNDLWVPTTSSTKERLLSLEMQKEELENKTSLEKSKQIKPLEVTKVKAFLKFFANKKYEAGQEINEFLTLLSTELYYMMIRF